MVGFYGYQVEYKLSNVSQFMMAVKVSHASGVTMYSADVTGLSHNTEYTVKVTMYRQHGHLLDYSVSPSQHINTTTLCASGYSSTLHKIFFKKVSNVGST